MGASSVRIIHRLTLPSADARSLSLHSGAAFSTRKGCWTATHTSTSTVLAMGRRSSLICLVLCRRRQFPGRRLTMAQSFNFRSDYFWKVCRVETLPVWSLLSGDCSIDHLGCLAALPPLSGSCWEVSKIPCIISIDEDWEGTLDIGTLSDREYIFRANGFTYTQDNIAQLQGLVVHGEFEVRYKSFAQFSICPGEPPNMSGPWGTEPWTCTAAGDPCDRLYEFRGVTFVACTQQFSDTGDADGDGSAHNGHPHCVTSVGDSLCGPCSCGPGEEQTYRLSRLYGHTPQVPLVFCSLCTPGKFRSVGNNSGPTSAKSALGVFRLWREPRHASHAALDGLMPMSAVRSALQEPSPPAPR